MRRDEKNTRAHAEEGAMPFGIHLSERPYPKEAESSLPQRPIDMLDGKEGVCRRLNGK